MKKQLLLSAALIVIAVTAFPQDSSLQPGKSAVTASGAPANASVILTPSIYFDEFPVNHNMHITADSNYYYAINGGSSSSGQINKFDLTGLLLQTYPILIDGRGLSYNKADGYLYASLYLGDIVRIDDLATGTFTTLFPAVMQNAQASFAISDDGTKFYDFYAGTLVIHDFTTGAVINTLYGLSAGTGNFGGEAAVAVDSIYIYTWDAAVKTVYVYDTAGTFQQSIIISDGDNGHSLAFADHKLFVSKDGNYSIGTWYGYDLSTPTGIVSASINNTSFSVYPNPAKDLLMISGKASPNDEKQIYDLSGRKVFQSVASDQSSIINGRTSFTIDVSSLWPGIYFLKAGNEERKFVKE
jgi:hypothetical protein